MQPRYRKAHPVNGDRAFFGYISEDILRNGYPCDHCIIFGFKRYHAATGIRMSGNDMSPEPSSGGHGPFKIDRRTGTEVLQCTAPQRLRHDIRRKTGIFESGHCQAYTVHCDTVTYGRTFKDLIRRYSEYGAVRTVPYGHDSAYFLYDSRKHIFLSNVSKNSFLYACISKSSPERAMSARAIGTA